MNKDTFRQEQMLNLKGKAYLPVAPRIVIFRQDHPDWCILTETKLLGEDIYVYACVQDSTNRIIATAHKRMDPKRKGPAGSWPLETAETGAIGRALGLCGYGTLGGDFDEGDQLADAPVTSPKQGEELIEEIRKAKNLESLAALRNKAASLELVGPVRERAVDAYTEAKKRLGG